MTADTSTPLNPLNRRCLRVKLNGAAELINEVYWGMIILDGPAKVSPRTLTLDLLGPTFQHAFPANSLTVLRVKAEK